MNILPINSYQLPKFFNAKSVNNTFTNFGIKMTSPITEDTVSFKGVPTPKQACKVGGLSRANALKIHEIIEKRQGEIGDFVRGIHHDFLVSDVDPNNLIKYISERAKSVDSIMQKSKILDIDCIHEIFLKMTDLNGTKEVLRDGTRKNVHKALDIWLDAIKRRFVILEEVEVKRPKAAEKLKGKEKFKWDYADPNKLEEFVSTAEEFMGKKVRFSKADYTAVNYSAIHFLFRMPGTKVVFEHQLTGPNVALLKDLDDIFFKVLNNKSVDKKFQPLVEILKPITLSIEEKTLLKYIKIREKLEKYNFNQEDIETIKNKLMFNRKLMCKSDKKDYAEKMASLMKSKDINEQDLFLLFEDTTFEKELYDKEIIKNLKKKAERSEKFKNYRSQAFLFQREKKTIPRNDDSEYFLPLSIDLPHEFDLNNLYKIYRECLK